MNHREHLLPGTLADHAEGLLGEFASGVVLAHLEECAECRSTAMLLDVLRDILAADDPGPMPRRHSARIGARLAELAITEPVPIAQPVVALLSAGADIIDLASRRTVQTGAVRRLGTVAAGVVVVMCGAALGVATVGGHGAVERRGALGPPTGVVPPTITFTAFPTAPPGSTDGPHGSKEGPNHWIYTKNKVFLPGGEVVVRSRTPGAPPTVISPAHRSAGSSKPGAGRATGPQPAATATQAPAGRVAPTAAATPTAASSPPPSPGSAVAQPTPGVSAPPAPADGSVRTAAREPYIAHSGAAYAQDNFASRVMDLMRDAAADQPVADGGEQRQPDPQEDPAAPGVQSQVDTVGAGGPTRDGVRARVLRCAAQVRGQAIAGDDGTWLDRPATIVVVPSDRPDQVVGYVFYGDCRKKGPATASDYEWKQQVDTPTGGPGSTAPARVDDVTGAGESQREIAPVEGPAPTSPPPPATAAATTGPAPE